MGLKTGLAAMGAKLTGLGTGLAAAAPAALPAAGLAAAALTPTLLAALPSKEERAYRKSVTEQAKRLGKARGGLSAGERQQMEAEGQQRLQAQMQQAQTDISRMRDPVARQRAMSQLQRGAMGQRAAISSDVRQQDLDLYAKQLAQHMQDQYKVAQSGAARRRAGAAALLETGKLMSGKGAKLGSKIGEGFTEAYGKYHAAPFDKYEQAFEKYSGE